MSNVHDLVKTIEISIWKNETYEKVRRKWRLGYVDEKFRLYQHIKFTKNYFKFCSSR